MSDKWEASRPASPKRDFSPNRDTDSAHNKRETDFQM